MEYQQTLEYIYAQLPMYSRLGIAAYKNDITNTVILCEHLGNPHAKFKSIHIAGTNGKGSTSHMMAAIFQSAGYKTGLYTSPHLKDFRERIKVDGEMIPEEYVTEFVARLKPLIEAIEPSFFEITVAMAFEYFAQRQVEIAIVEVGLGGRLDSTNIITPELSIITNIGMDHMNLLGDTLEKIAAEKAGIIKKEIPVVVGDFHPATSHVFENIARQKTAPLTFASTQRYIYDWKFEPHELVVEVSMAHSDEKQFFHLDLTGLYQTKNLVTVLEAVKVLKSLGWNLSDQSVQHGMRHIRQLTGLHGRWETIHEHPRVILDVAHNEDGMKEIKSQLEFTSYQHLHIVIGMVKDKAIEKVLSLLPKTATYYFTKAQIPRALPETELAGFGEYFGLQGRHYPDVNTALQTAFTNAVKADCILVCGSVFIVGEVDKKILQTGSKI